MLEAVEALAATILNMLGNARTLRLGSAMLIRLPVSEGSHGGGYSFRAAHRSPCGESVLSNVKPWASA